MKKPKKVIKVLAIVIAVVILGWLIYGCGFILHQEISRRKVLDECTSSAATTTVDDTTNEDYGTITLPEITESETDESEEFGFENINDYDADKKLWVSVDSVSDGYVYTSYHEDDGIEFYKGMLFEDDNVVTSIRHIKSSENYQSDSSLRYRLTDNNQITYLGLDEYNNDLIIVKRLSMKTKSGGGALLLECTDCGDEMAYMLASSIDWSSGKVVTESGRKRVRYTLL